MIFLHNMIPLSDARLFTLRLTTSDWLTTFDSQRLNSGKPLGISCCEWLWL